MHGPLQCRHRQTFSRFEGAEILPIDYAEHRIYVHVAVEIDIGVGRRIKAAVVVQEFLIRQLGNVLRVPAGNEAVGRVGIEGAHHRILLQLVRVCKGSAHLVVDHALASELAVPGELVMPALLAEYLALAVYHRTENGVEIHPHQIQKILRVAAGYGVIGLVREGHRVQEGVHGSLHELDERLLHLIPLRAAEHRVLQDVEHTRVILRQRREGDTESSVDLASFYPDKLQPRTLMPHEVHYRIQLRQRLSAYYSKTVIGCSFEHISPPWSSCRHYSPNILH